MRYGGPGSAGKHLTVSEANALTGAGLWIVALAEGTERGLSGGARIGDAWARSAHDHFVQCGMPPSRPIYFAVDWDVQAAEWPNVRQALAAAGAVLGAGRVGIYGGLNAVSWAARDGVAAWFFQTYAWSRGQWSPRAHVRQYRNNVSLVGGTVDLDTAMVSDYGQWTVKGLPPGEGMNGMDENQEKTVLDAAYSTLHCYGVDGQPATALHVWTAYVNQSLSAIDQQLVNLAKASGGQGGDGTDIGSLVAEIRALAEQVRDAPLIDAVAVAQAIAANPEISRTLAAQVAAQLSTIQGSITLSGSLSGGIRPPSE